MVRSYNLIGTFNYKGYEIGEYRVFMYANTGRMLGIKGVYRCDKLNKEEEHLDDMKRYIDSLDSRPKARVIIIEEYDNEPFDYEDAIRRFGVLRADRY